MYIKWDRPIVEEGKWRKIEKKKKKNVERVILSSRKKWRE